MDRVIFYFAFEGGIKRDGRSYTVLSGDEGKADEWEEFFQWLANFRVGPLPECSTPSQMRTQSTEHTHTPG